MALSRDDWDKWLLGLLSAAFLALTGWIYTTGNRVTALETQDKSTGQKLDEIQQDVRQIRDWIIPVPPPGRR